MHIEISGLTLKYKDFVAVDDVSIEVPDGQSLVLLGESGCGKTSTMRCIAGLENPVDGRIAIGGRTVFDGAGRVNLPPNKRNVGMVFQSYAVWPNKTVFENVAFPLQRQRKSSQQIKQRVNEVLELTGLEKFSQRGASLLSGGQMQRVALARSLAMSPAIMLLDEPLSNLDAQLRERLRNELRRIQQEAGLTSVYVTHDQTEALALADNIAMMQHGRIVQYGTPTQIYDSPASASIASFMGVTNVFSLAGSTPGNTKVNGTSVNLSLDTSKLGSYKLCVRPNDISLVRPSATSADNEIRGRVVVSIFQGGYTAYEIIVSDSLSFLVNVPKTAERFSVGDTVAMVFSAKTMQLLPDE
ncbi:ABC transporter ATP-binding protein [Salinibacterium sp. ZJ450]|uniref:ABC transporter ATP-binding protein n=1 Tax=Salinibacterium sp. ZJ450 TaxID=2708338 RepID=UPI00142287D2|nr:ABC transporter ATP-binding protein [Salinibacterium sp. ZJ450]